MPARQENYTEIFNMLSLPQKQQLYQEACSFFSTNKQDLFDTLARQRTRHITVVLEDIYQSHNASAVLRSCDCFGVQDVHVIEKSNQYHISSEVAMGSNKWVDYYLHHDTLQTYNLLREKGYKIVATTPHEGDVLVGDLDVSQPLALVFGTELTGLSPEAISHADLFVKIPMYGFTESFNISVSAALCLFSVTERMRKQPHLHWQLSEDELITLKLYWARQVIQHGNEVFNHLLKPYMNEKKQ